MITTVGQCRSSILIYAKYFITFLTKLLLVWFNTFRHNLFFSIALQLASFETVLHFNYHLFVTTIFNKRSLWNKNVIPSLKLNSFWLKPHLYDFKIFLIISLLIIVIEEYNSRGWSNDTLLKRPYWSVVDCQIKIKCRWNFVANLVSRQMVQVLVAIMWHQSWFQHKTMVI